MNTPLTFGTACTGIGGIDLGLRQAGLSCRFQCEILPFDRALLAQNFPECAARFVDVRDIGAHCLPSVDLFAFGFMCTDITTVNRHSKDIHADTRSGNTWRECIRVVSETRPRFVLIENVADLYHRGLDTVLSTLATLRYDAEWHCIPASFVGAPHVRRRLFIVAYSNDFAGLETNTPAFTFGDFWKGRKDARQDAGSSYWTTVPAPDWAVLEAVSVRVADGSPYRLDALKGIGNAVCPPITRLIGEWFTEAFSVTASATTASATGTPPTGPANAEQSPDPSAKSAPMRAKGAQEMGQGRGEGAG